jgi:hypothetical protein
MLGPSAVPASWIAAAIIPALVAVAFASAAFLFVQHRGAPWRRAGLAGIAAAVMGAVGGFILSPPEVSPSGRVTGAELEAMAKLTRPAPASEGERDQ